MSFMSFPVEESLGRYTRSINQMILPMFPGMFTFLCVLMLILGFLSIPTAGSTAFLVMFLPFIFAAIWMGIGCYFVMMYGIELEHRYACLQAFCILVLPALVMVATWDTHYTGVLTLISLAMSSALFFYPHLMGFDNPDINEAFIKKYISVFSNGVTCVFIVVLFEAIFPYEETVISDVYYGECYTSTSRQHNRVGKTTTTRCVASFTYQGKTIHFNYNRSNRSPVRVRHGIFDHFEY